MRVRDGGEHVEEQPDARGHVERALVAVAIDVLAAHVFEHEVRLADRRHARVDQAGDRRMRQAREDRAFTPEAIFTLAADQRRVQQLDRRVPFEAAVAAPRQPHRAHAAMTDRRDQRVGANLLSGERRARGRLGRLRGVGEEPAALDRLLLGEQAFEIVRDLRRLRPHGGQQRAAFFGREIERLFQVRTDSLPPGGIEE